MASLPMKDPYPGTTILDQDQRGEGQHYTGRCTSDLEGT